MRTSRTLLALTAAVGVLAVVAAGAGVFLGGGVGPFAFTNVQGDPVEMYGVGIYDHDSLMRGSGQRGVDAVTLFLVVPLMAASAWLHRRGSLRGTLVLGGTLLWFTYAGISYVAAVAYNELFLVYVALFGTSFYAVLLAFAAVDRDALAHRIGPGAPRRAPAAFLFVIGTFTLGIWLVTPLDGLLRGQPPSDLDSYTSMFTNGFDIAVIVPATFVAGALMLRRDPLGYALGVPLVVFAGLLAPMVAAMTVYQVRAGVDFTTGEVVGPISGFMVLAAVAVWLVVVLLRHVGETTSGPTPLRPRTLVR
jgi:hypothetical protein